MHSGVTQETLISTRGHWIALRQGDRNEEQIQREDEELGRGLGIEGSQIIRNNFFFF